MSYINAQTGNATVATALITSADNAAALAFQVNDSVKFQIDAIQNANCTTTGSFIVPVGTTAQRPASPVNGMVRFNTTNNALEGYANNIWVRFQTAPSSVNTVAPVISGIPSLGSTLTSTTGTWLYEPISYSYQWLANTTSITNATSNTFVLTNTQVGANITCNVSAINVVGPSNPVTSNSLGPVTTAINATALLVAGGGGGASALGGGGGAGGVISLPSLTLTPGTVYTFVVGGGGASQTSGTSSTAFGATAAGGGTSGPHDYSDGTAGGSGGGAASNNSRINTGGASSGNSLGSNTGTIYGNAGGSMTTARTGEATRAAGGGGAGAAAANTNSNSYAGDTNTGLGAGGIGITSSITGSSLYYGGGGGGGAYLGNGYAGNGGLGGGGAGSGNNNGGLGGGSALNSGANGGSGSNVNGAAGGANTGGGGGGASWQTNSGGAGGKGVFILSIPTTRYTGTTTGSPTVTTSGANTILIYTSSGTYTA
jgi:hypothetical protein